MALKRSEEPHEQCPTEAMEEDMCETERYLDMYKDIEKERVKEEEERKRRDQRNAIGFDYGTGSNSSNTTIKEESDSEEDEPFEAPTGVKFPVGLELPPNMKQHRIIEKTASFIVANGAQMEIVIKAKQRNNSEQFGFLEFDNRLNPFYKYLQKLIREKKYVPDITKRSKQLKSGISKPAVSSSLAAIAAAHGSGSDSDSDNSGSDCELHPSLLSGSLKPPLSPEKPGAIGPKKKPIVVEKAPQIASVDISQRNDVYAALFKNLTSMTQQAKTTKEPEKSTVTKEKEDADSLPFGPIFVRPVRPFVRPSAVRPLRPRDGRVDDPEYREWFEAFYNRPCPWIGPRPMLPPTPDLEPILNSYAEHVAQKGAEFEENLASRQDLQLHFMDPKSPYYSFYQHKIRIHQWRFAQEYARFPQPIASGSSPAPTINADIPTHSISNSQSNDANANNSPGPASLMSLSLATPPEPPKNRRQRRRLLENNKFDESLTEPGVIDPLNTPITLPKSASTPANLLSLEVSKPVSFTLKPVEEPKIHEETSFRFDPDFEDLEEKPSTSSVDSSILPPPPVPPMIPNSTQIDRKEKARIFMEKLLLEKKLKKQQEDEDRMKLEEETRRKAEKISEFLSERKAGKRDEPQVQKSKERTLDDIINNRINSLLSESGFETETEPAENENAKKEDEGGDGDKEKERKKHVRIKKKKDIPLFAYSRKKEADRVAALAQGTVPVTAKNLESLKDIDLALALETVTVIVGIEAEVGTEAVIEVIGVE
uniref:SURP motif domain-containing protein n=1 Tax=Caenorhabditis japonica TaxID=281687 RepID=K7H9U1_CAEJA